MCERYIYPYIIICTYMYVYTRYTAYNVTVVYQASMTDIVVSNIQCDYTLAI